MGQLLVREIDDSLVRKLKSRAIAHGVSTEEEHRRILKEVLSRPRDRKPSLLEFLISAEGEVAPGIELDLTRRAETESRDTGI